MTISIGTINANKISVGSTEILKVSVGDVLVFPTGVTPPATISRIYVDSWVGVTSASSPLPANCFAGQLLMCINKADGNAPDLSVFAPTGFTLIEEAISSTLQAALVVSYKVLTQADINNGLIVTGMQSNINIQQMILLAITAEEGVLNPVIVPITGATINSSSGVVIATKPSDITIPIGSSLAFNSVVSMGVYGSSAIVDPKRFTINTGGAGGTPSEYNAGTANSLYVKFYNNNFGDVSAVVGMDDEGSENTLAGISFSAIG